MSRFAVVLLASVALVATSCTDDEPSHEWTDLPSEFGGANVSNATEVAATDTYRLVVGDAPPNSASPGTRCVQLIVGGEGIGCIRVGRDDGSSGGHSADVRSDGQRIIWRGRTSSDEPASVVAHFVVWSSLDPDGRRIEPIDASGTTNLIWVMRPGESPWGYQSIAGDGSLIQAQSLVGLPDS